MATKRIREYKLYTQGCGDVTNKYYPQTSKPWILTVRARSIKQAYWLVSNEEVWDGEKGSVGISFIDHSWGPKMLEKWPFGFNIGEVGNHWKR